MRLFIALPMNEEAAQTAAELQASLRRAGVSGRWSRPENLHITMAFLGEQPPAALAAASEAMTELCALPAPFTLDRLEVFQSSEVLCLAPSNDRAIRAAAEELAAALRGRGFRLEERRFRAHLTLCRRVKLPLPAELPQLLPVCSRMDELVLFESHRPAGVLTYAPRFRCYLGDKNEA